MDVLQNGVLITLWSNGFDCCDRQRRGARPTQMELVRTRPPGASLPGGPRGIIVAVRQKFNWLTTALQRPKSCNLRSRCASLWPAK